MAKTKALSEEAKKRLELMYIQEVLSRNREKQFVQRILYPNEYPSFDMGEGWIGTHLMGWEKYQGRNLVYPHIIYNEQSGRMQRLSGGSALSHALETGEYIEFDSSEEADFFSKHYKRVWQ